MEVFSDEKIDGLHIFFKKFLSTKEYQIYQEAGTKYIEKSLNRTKLFKIEIKHMTGKKGIK